MRLTKALITAVVLTVAVMGAVLAAVTASSGMFGFHDWPEAPAVAPQARAVDIGTSPAREPRADARPKPERAAGTDGALLAQVPSRAPASTPAALASAPPAPVARSSPQPREARGEAPTASSQPEPETQPAPAVAPVPEPMSPVPGGVDLSAKEIPEDPVVSVPTWDGPEQARRHTHRGRRNGTE